ncbi:MAG: hypothetical protein ACE5KG_07300, partial [Nitrososphaerales archaeon]
GNRLMKNPLKKIGSIGKDANVEEKGTKVCQSCGKNFPLELNFCQDCGIQLTEAVIKVPKVVASKTTEAKPQVQRTPNSPIRPQVQQAKPAPARPSMRAPVREPTRSDNLQNSTRRYDPEITMIKDSVEKMQKMVGNHGEMLDEIRREQLRLSTDMEMLMDFLRMFNESARNTISRSVYESKERG